MDKIAHLRRNPQTVVLLGGEYYFVTNREKKSKHTYDSEAMIVGTNQSASLVSRRVSGDIYDIFILTTYFYIVLGHRYIGIDVILHFRNFNTLKYIKLVYLLDPEIDHRDTFST